MKNVLKSDTYTFLSEKCAPHGIRLTKLTGAQTGNLLVTGPDEQSFTMRSNTQWWAAQLKKLVKKHWDVDLG